MLLDRSYLDSAVETMRAQRIPFAPGLTAPEFEAAEREHGFRFPPDLRAFLAHALPVDERFPDWRKPGSADLRERLVLPADRICFDVQHGRWFPGWGPRPDSLADAEATAWRAISNAPFLIPIFAHRYLPADPCEAGNPVFSVYQLDIIYYGLDLCDYLRAEFGVANPYAVPAQPREIRLWSDLERFDDY